ncbi:YicC/YloC family endoribonuclease [Porphyromonas crevioricanis]|uniref:YicC/YloC family endoribonuclease n=1 Tax=Porphyromonas crevioricanis TaxID=393921 RepID=UPI000B2F08F9|nr:YicC/YloC family endoribonuclease [Porphyromonas crevioricanis]
MAFFLNPHLIMILSMTGFGKASTIIGMYKVTATVRSLNSKQLDLSTRIASRYRERELELRTRIGKKLIRGKADFTLFIEPINANNELAPFSKAAATEYVDLIRQLCQELDMAEPDNLLQIALSIPKVYKEKEEEEDSDVGEAEWSEILSLTDRALNEFSKFREQEGQMLQQVFTNAIGRINQMVDKIETIEPLRIESVRRQIEERLSQLPSDIVYDKGRLEQELIYYIEKLDVSEERNRLRNHLSYFVDTMNLEPGQGKKLGFIAQEIGREINTLGSKSNEVRMQQLVVEMKDELEQIREQVLNTL